ncbi:Uncharacterised protein [Vibrio cholerae]|nr:Uncharacterised protein [Vibrio cholerae]
MSRHLKYYQLSVRDDVYNIPFNSVCRWGIALPIR